MPKSNPNIRKIKPYHSLTAQGKRHRKKKLHITEEFEELIEINASQINYNQTIEQHEKYQSSNNSIVISTPSDEDPSLSINHLKCNSDSPSDENHTQSDIQYMSSVLVSSQSQNKGDPENEESFNLDDFYKYIDNCCNPCDISSDQPSEYNSEDSDSMHEKDEQNCSDPVVTFLRNWSIKNNITTSALSELCVGLKRNHTCFKNLPVDGRTIKKTPVNLPIIDTPPGKYIHVGIEKQLVAILKNLPTSENTRDLGILLNIDGLPLFRSSSAELYPILFSIPCLNNNVYPAGLYFGPKKPADLDNFLAPLVEESKKLTDIGLRVGNKIYTVHILGFCCDAPAKSFILGTIGHTGYSSCTRCHVVGDHIEKRVVFLNEDDAQRTHSEFISRSDVKYQPRTTPLVQISGLHFPSSFVLDYMHLICLGVVRTLLHIWCSGPYPLRLSKTQRDLISENLLSLKPAIPSEFARKPRGVDQLKNWKATELRMFLLYLGPIVLKKVLHKENYSNFLVLQVATSILLSSEQCKDPNKINYARELMINFVKTVKVLYGDMYVTHNFHNLIHIADDADFFSNKIPNFTLHSLSAFAFENYLQSVKRRVRGGARPLEQIGKRLLEFMSAQDQNFEFSKVSAQFPSFSGRHNKGPLGLACDPQFTKMQLEGCEITSKPPNNCVQLKNGDIVLVENIAHAENHSLLEPVIIGRKYMHYENMFDSSTELCDSRDLGIHRVRNLGNEKMWQVKKISKKCLHISFEGKKYVFPLLH